MQKRTNPKTMPEESLNPFGQVGSFLKQTREEQGLSVSEIASSLRIGEEQLVAIENGEEHLLPEKVFVKAMIRRVAERLGLDSSPLIKKLDPKKLQSEKSIRALGTNEKEVSLTDYLKDINLITSCFVLLFLIISSSIILRIGTRTDSLQKTTIEGKEELSGSNLASQDIYALQISSLKPTKATIKDSQDKVLFEGIILRPIRIETTYNLQIFSRRPDLIEITKESGDKIKLGKGRKLKWYRIDVN